ncbi:MAG TPA: hemerythrin domain-containing protein [Thermoanaerobaculia bacterium]|nr:hemerythrin domain-containing protein [Thermoanaerobaculia bacterium]
MPLLGRLIGEIAATVPGAIEAFGKAGIDCCRDASLTLDEVSERDGVSTAGVLSLLNQDEPATKMIDWLVGPLTGLTRFVTGKLHPAEIAAMERVSSRLAHEQEDHPANAAIARLRSAFAEVANNVTIHMWREDNEVFPFIEAMEKEQGIAPPPVRGAFPNPHDPLLEGLRRLREMTAEYSRPPGPASMDPILADLRAFDDMLHRHFHLESHILYPRASALCACPLGDRDAASDLTWF